MSGLAHDLRRCNYLLGLSAIAPRLEHKVPSAFHEFFAPCGLNATGTQEFGHHDHIQSCPSREGEQMVVDLESWEAGYDDGLLGRRPNAPPVSTGSRIRAATSRLAHVAQGRRKTFGRATRPRQPSGPRNEMEAALG